MKFKKDGIIGIVNAAVVATAKEWSNWVGFKIHPIHATDVV